MITAVADTHAVIWYIYGDVRLSAPATHFINTAFAAGDHIGVSSITLVEMVYLIEKNRIALESFSRVAAALNEIDSLFIEVPIDLDIARALSRISGAQISDMPDRIVAATAIYLNVPIISRDSRIRVSGVSTIW